MKLAVLAALVPALMISCDQRPAPAPAPPRPAPAAPDPVEETPSPTARVFAKLVALSVDASTWLEGKPFDIGSSLRNLLEKADILVVGEAETPIDGHLHIEYSEKKGHGYGLDPQAPAKAGFGTNIRYRLNLRRGEEDVRLLEGTATTPDEADMFDLRGEAVRAFLKSPTCRYSGQFVAAALGLKESIPAVLESALDGETGHDAVALLARLGYRPAGPREEAVLAIGERKFDRCVGIGVAAVDPLVESLSKTRSTSESLDIAKVLVRLGDARAGRPLLERARRLALRMKTWTDPVSREVEGLIAAAGEVGDATLLEDLAAWPEKTNGSFQGDVARATESIKKRTAAR